MAKKVYSKQHAPNKHLVQDHIYNWLGERFYGEEVIILPGMYPEKAVERVTKFIKGKPVISAHEIDYKTADFIRVNSYQKIQENILKNGEFGTFNLYWGDVRNAESNAPFQDLDFCSTWVKNRNRARNEDHFLSDPIEIIKHRVMLQKENIPDKWKAMIGTITCRSGIGKYHSMKCLNSICNVIGWEIKKVDGWPYPHYSGYSKYGSRLKGGGCLHPNGCVYYARKHSILIEPVTDSKEINKAELRFFTYTDTQPMFVFALAFK